MLAAFVAFAGLALTITSVVPNVYVSESLILFRPREVSTEFVKDISSGATDERLTAIQETLMSRSNLLRIIKEFEPAFSPYRGMSDGRKVERMRSQVEIEFLSEKVRNVLAPVTHVRIRYREQHPELAQKIASRLSSLLIAQENRTRETQVYGTTAFLKSELAKVMERLAESRQRLKSVKEVYRDELPSQLEANLRTLDRLQDQKTANLEALDRQTSLKLTLERQLSETPAQLPETFGFTAAAGATNPAVEAYLDKEQLYSEMVAKATEKHPDVIRLKAELGMMRQSLAAEDLDSLAAYVKAQTKRLMSPNPLYQSLAAQLSQVTTEIEIQKREKGSIERQIRQCTLRVQNTPHAEQAIAAAERQNLELTEQAGDLQTKLDQARLAESIERQQQGAQFVVVDPANYPADPASPNRTALQASGVALSLALALALGVGVDLSKRRVFTGAELERMLKGPILVEIPRIKPRWNSSEVRRTRLKQGALLVGALCVYAWGLYQLYAHQDSVRRALDPFIQIVQG